MALPWLIGAGAVVAAAKLIYDVVKDDSPSSSSYDDDDAKTARKQAAKERREKQKAQEKERKRQEAETELAKLEQDFNLEGQHRFKEIRRNLKPYFTVKKQPNQPLMASGQNGSIKGPLHGYPFAQPPYHGLGTLLRQFTEAQKPQTPNQDLSHFAMLGDTVQYLQQMLETYNVTIKPTPELWQQLQHLYGFDEMAADLTNMEEDLLQLRAQLQSA